MTGIARIRDGMAASEAIGNRLFTPLEPPADGNTLICCCRPQGNIVIDL